MSPSVHDSGEASPFRRQKFCFVSTTTTLICLQSRVTRIQRPNFIPLRPELYDPITCLRSVLLMKTGSLSHTDSDLYTRMSLAKNEPLQLRPRILNPLLPMTIFTTIRTSGGKVGIYPNPNALSWFMGFYGPFVYLYGWVLWLKLLRDLHYYKALAQASSPILSYVINWRSLDFSLRSEIVLLQASSRCSSSKLIYLFNAKFLERGSVIDAYSPKKVCCSKLWPKSDFCRQNPLLKFSLPVSGTIVTVSTLSVYQDFLHITTVDLISLYLITVAKSCFDYGSPVGYSTPAELILGSGLFPEAYLLKSTVSGRDSNLEPKPLFTQPSLQLQTFIVFSLRVSSRQVGELLSYKEDKAYLLLMVRRFPSFIMSTISSSLLLNLMELCVPLALIHFGVILIVIFFGPRINSLTLLVSLETIHRQSSYSKCNNFCSSDGQVGTTSSKPYMFLNVLMYYAPSVADCRDLGIGFSVLVKLGSIIRSIAISVGILLNLVSYCDWWDFVLDLSLDGWVGRSVLIILIQHVKLRHSFDVIDSQSYISTSLSDGYSRVRESHNVLPLSKRSVIPEWFLIIQRFVLALERSRPIQAAKWRATKLDSLYLPPTFDSLECSLHLSHGELCCIITDIHASLSLFEALSCFSFVFILNASFSFYAGFFIVIEHIM